MQRNYKYRIYPNTGQQVALSAMLLDFCSLYNAALEQRVEVYRRFGKSLSYADQCKELKATRCGVPDLSRWSYTAEQQVLRKLDKVFKAFWGRLSRGQAPGFPRFKVSARYRAADFRVGDGLTLRRSGKFTVVGVPGEVKVKWHRDMPSKPKTAVVRCHAGKWYVVFAVDVVVADTCHTSRDSVGLDMGLTSLVAMSNGETIDRPNWTKKAAKGLRKRQRALSRCVRGSNNKKKRKIALARYQEKVANRRRDFLHKLSRTLVDRFGRIAVEDLDVKGMVRGKFAKDIYDASWTQLIAMLRYKAESAGVEFVCVDRRGTSQTCPKCGLVKPKTLAERRHRCNCGCVCDRDVAAAIIVHQRAFGFSPGTGHSQLSGPVAA